MAHKEIPAWLDTAAIAAALEQAKAPGKEELQEIFAKSLNLQNLTIEEAASLMAVEDPADRRAIQVTANMVKEKVYGDRVVLTAPLHVSNYCDSECTYCANKHSNMLVERKRMTRDEIVEATRKLIRHGHKRGLLVAGAADGCELVPRHLRRRRAAGSAGAAASSPAAAAGDSPALMTGEGPEGGGWGSAGRCGTPRLRERPAPLPGACYSTALASKRCPAGCPDAGVLAAASSRSPALRTPSLFPH